jgi:hypothetical protein
MMLHKWRVISEITKQLSVSHVSFFSMELFSIRLHHGVTDDRQNLFCCYMVTFLLFIY